MSIRRRCWNGPDGAAKEAWVVDYADQHGKRHIKTFARKKDAERYQAETTISVRSGTHAADSTSVTVAEAARLWLISAEGNALERASLLNYRRFADLHIGPLIGSVKLSQLTVPLVRQFEDRLRVNRSPNLAREVIRALGTILADAQERGLVAQNVVRSLRTQRRRGKEARSERRRRGKLKVGIDIPSPDEIRTLIGQLDGRWRPLFLTAIFSGLRASELRGLRWIDVDLKRGEIHVRQRADRFRAIGPPKSEAGERTVPIAPMLANALRQWKLVCPKGELGLAFPNGIGNVEALNNIVHRGLIPAHARRRPDNAERQGQIHRLAQPAALLRQLVHQPPRRRRTRAAAESGTGAGSATPRSR